MGGSASLLRRPFCFFNLFLEVDIGFTTGLDYMCSVFSICLVVLLICLLVSVLVRGLKSLFECLLIKSV